jgi:hypothetical membrane protein
MTRGLALGGVIGPAAFVGAWVTGGAATAGYSPVADAISRLAARGAATQPLMTAGFVAFGLAVPAYAAALRRAVPGRAWVAAAATGIATLGVAGVPLETGRDALHDACAVTGYATLAAVPLLASRPLAAVGRRRAARASIATGALSSVCLLLSLAGPAHGLFQRAGLTIGDAWLVTSAVAIIRGFRLAPDPREAERG